MSCASCSHAPCYGTTCLVNHGFLPLHGATLHMHHASMHHALCNMPHAPCPVHHAPLSLHHAILHVHHVFQKCNCHIAPTLLHGEWGHSAQSVVQGHMVHGAWAWIIGMGHGVWLTGSWCTGATHPARQGLAAPQRLKVPTLCMDLLRKLTICVSDNQEKVEGTVKAEAAGQVSLKSDRMWSIMYISGVHFLAKV